MIKGIHGVFHTPQAEANRAFIREALELPEVDGGDGWSIFSRPKAEFAFHPGEDTHHEIAFWCDDINQTVSDLEAKGAGAKDPIVDQGFGLATTLVLPGGGEILLNELRHPQPGAG